MTRVLLALLGLFLLAAAPARDWSAIARPTPAGSYVIGAPTAPLKLVEYASYTCPHCAHFTAESDAELTPLIRSGRVSLEVRHVVRDGLDLAAALVARCGGPARFARLHRAVFAGQSAWLERGSAYAAANESSLRLYPVMGQFRALADGSGLLAIGRANGLSAAELDRCFADQVAADRLTDMTAALPREVTGTPAFYLNGKLLPASGWAQLRPLLRAPGAR